MKSDRRNEKSEVATNLKGILKDSPDGPTSSGPTGRPFDCRMPSCRRTKVKFHQPIMTATGPKSMLT